MKTTDLIPIILYQLVDDDKYGYEIVKQIEDSSNGGIVIKQPTLYSVLKKLEQGKFISSYWQDSEIGGKRHYYKLTDNGRAQLSTYPPFETLIKDMIESEGITVSTTNSNININPTTSLNNDEINDNTIELTYNPSPIDLTNTFKQKDEVEIDLSLNPDNIANEFSEESIDNNVNQTIDSKQDYFTSTSSIDINNEINQEKSNNSHISNIFDAIDYDNISSQTDEEVQLSINSINEELVVNTEEKPQENNAKFTEKVQPIIESISSNKLYDKLTPSTDILNQVSSNVDPDANININNQIEEVKFLNYVDFNKDKTVISRRQAITKHIQKMALTCISLLLVFVASLVVCNKYSFSKVYYLSAIVVCLVLILYPTILLSNIAKIRFKYCSKPFKYHRLQDFFIKLSLFLSLIIIIFAYNLTINTNIKTIFKLANFASFYAPIIFGFMLILDFIYNSIIYKKYTK